MIFEMTSNLTLAVTIWIDQHVDRTSSQYSTFSIFRDGAQL